MKHQTSILLKTLDDETDIYGAYIEETDSYYVIVDNHYDGMVKFEFYDENSLSYFKNTTSKGYIDLYQNIIKDYPGVNAIFDKVPNCSTYDLVLVIFNDGSFIYTYELEWLNHLEDGSLSFKIKDKIYSFKDVFLIQNMIPENVDPLSFGEALIALQADSYLSKELINEYLDMKGFDEEILESLSDYINSFESEGSLFESQDDDEDVFISNTNLLN